jgi:chromosome segregation protein
MLKALELSGFKSFADKTRFEFPPGITVVVGPNGSGKSNIVDAIKWVLGEQSAKSLRGKDMADVIFKGTGRGGRKVMNTAEATIIFDNADGRLPVDAPEVHVTRRVYRSGEGEYLINRQPCRLRDIRDMFRGTGVGTDAYSLIEQGKVDQLLQASPRDRRAIFEEAAGISRFKAKKIEAQRRLERVDQNLLRLSDIVEEVGSRVRSVRSQASKARRYREYSDRLQQLRTQVGLADWRQLTEKLQVAEADLQRMRDQIGGLNAEMTHDDARSLELETEIIGVSEAIRDAEHRLARSREQIAARQSLVELERERVRELETESAQFRDQARLLSGKAGDVQLRLQEIRTALQEAEVEFEGVSQQLATHEEAIHATAGHLKGWKQADQQKRATYLEQMQLAAKRTNSLTACESQRDAAEATLTRCQHELRQSDEQMATHQADLAQAQQAEQHIATQLAEEATKLETVERELADRTRVLNRRRDEMAAQSSRLSGMRERLSLLEEWEKSKEGLTAGVQEALRRAKHETSGPFAEVMGMVVELIDVPMQWAPMVDAALGTVAQHLVLRGTSFVDAVEQQRYRPAGRLGLIVLDRDTEVDHADADPLASEPGILGRLDQLVQAAPEYEPLVQRLFCRTWAVEMLSQARQFSARRPGCRFVTLAGEVVEADGTVVAGPKDAAGLVSRRSELRELQRDLGVVRRQIDEGRQEAERLQENIDDQQGVARQITQLRRELREQLSEKRVQTKASARQLDELQTRRHALVTEQQAAERTRTEALTSIDQLSAELVQNEQQLAQLKAEMDAIAGRLEDAETKLREHQEAAIGIRVVHAKSEERLDGLRQQLRQLEEDQHERGRALANVRTQLQSASDRRAQAERSILSASSELAELYLDQEALTRSIDGHNLRLRSLNGERTQLSEQLKAKQRRLNQTKEQLHQRELAAGEIRHDRSTLTERLRDDYGIEIAEIEEDVDDQEQQERAAIEAEIAALRRKISNIGAVNMEALNELDDLETRFSGLEGQYKDLSQAKESLERIIHKINADSRRLFSETLEAIRDNFQTLYRRAFGGGKADLVLEEGADILECGVDIVATPPGKPSFNNSLLSGGEKALTAVALLLAIFQYRPSPFCVLDEVDAPFDEANIGRFVDVLKGFLGWTKFVLVTHSKKTMTAATTLYGVTMQESGVSKQVSVRFEDVSEDGHISAEAIERSQREASDDERAA